jgi:urea-proton symporter
MEPILFECRLLCPSRSMLSITFLVKVEAKWHGTKETFERFYIAGGNVKTGLMSASIVSA